MTPDSAFRLARVLRVYGDYTADVTYLDDGWNAARLSIGCDMASSRTGNFEPPDLDPVSQPTQDPGSGTTYSIAIIINIRGCPTIIGFTRTAYSELLFGDGRAIHRFNSDVYRSVDANGNFELYHPAGSFVRMGETPDHEDLTGRDLGKRFKLRRNLLRRVYISIANLFGNTLLGMFRIDPAGNMTLQAAGSITLQAPNLTFQGDDSITFISPTVVNSGTFQSTKRISSDEDVSVGPVSLTNHGHTVTVTGTVGISQTPVGGGPAAGSLASIPGATLGMRNNNPGNLRAIPGTTWQGQIGTASGFVTFASPYFGLRALSLDLVNQQLIYGLSTVQDIITKFAPPSENDTQAYITDVAGKLGVNPTDQIDMTDPATLQTFTAAVVNHENGFQPYTITAVPAVPAAPGFIPMPDISSITNAVNAALGAAKSSANSIAGGIPGAAPAS